jgi:hypothetical protein
MIGELDRVLVLRYGTIRECWVWSMGGFSLVDFGFVKIPVEKVGCTTCHGKCQCLDLPWFSSSRTASEIEPFWR